MGLEHKTDIHKLVQESMLSLTCELMAGGRPPLRSKEHTREMFKWNWKENSKLVGLEVVRGGCVPCSGQKEQYLWTSEGENSPMAFQELKKSSEPRAQSVSRWWEVGADSKGRRLTMKNCCHIEESGWLRTRYCPWGDSNPFKHHSSVIKVLLAPFYWWGSWGSKTFSLTQRHRL